MEQAHQAMLTPHHMVLVASHHHHILAMVLLLSLILLSETSQLMVELQAHLLMATGEMIRAQATDHKDLTLEPRQLRPMVDLGDKKVKLLDLLVLVPLGDIPDIPHQNLLPALREDLAEKRVQTVILAAI